MEIEKQEVVSHFEEIRRLRSTSQYLRNQVYWRELRQLHKESFDDSHLLLHYMQNKLANQRKWNEHCKVTSLESMQSYNKSRTFANSEGRGSYNNAGFVSCKTLVELEEMLLKSSRESIDVLEQDFIHSFKVKLQRYEQDISTLWEKGKMLLISWKLLDRLILSLYQQLAVGVNINIIDQNTLSGNKDRWLLMCKYYIASHKFLKLVIHCNQQFRVLFRMAKELESSRITLVTRTAESFTVRLMDTIQPRINLHKSTAENIKNIPSLLATKQKPLSEELGRRVQEESVERGQFVSLASYQLQMGGDISNPLDTSSTETTIPGEKQSDISLPNVIDLLHCSSIKTAFICSKEDPGVVISSWIPTFAVITAKGWMHLFSLPSSIETQMPIASIFANLAVAWKLSYEDDVSKPMDPTLSSSECAKLSFSNSSFGNLCECLSLDDINAGKDDIWNRAIDAMVQKENFLEPDVSVNIGASSAILRPSALAAENVVTITETLSSGDSLFSFGLWPSERKVTLKFRTQHDAISAVTLLQSTKTTV